MPATTYNAVPLTLDPSAGPAMEPIRIAPQDSPAVLGRSSQCNFVLADNEGTVSRRHAEISFQGSSWWVNDLSSRHGTILNGVKLAPNNPAQLRHRDRLRMGPWTFRVKLLDGSDNSTIEELDSTEPMTMADDRGSSDQFVQKIEAAALGLDAQRRLDLLMECAAAMVRADSEDKLTTAALDALLAGTGFPRAAVLRIEGSGDQVRVVASRSGGVVPVPASAGPMGFSRSLIQAAMQGQTVVLNSSAMNQPNYGQSIMNLGITSAVCAPIVIDNEPDAFIYLDARQPDPRPGRSPQTPPINPETISFCQAIARLCGLAMANLQRVRLQHDDEQQVKDMEAARSVQRLIMPPDHGTLGPMSYIVHSRPGQRVAGDLFDFIKLDEHRAAVLIGDVEGKGIAAGMVMSNVQAHLSRLLRQTGDPGIALTEVSKLVADYSDRQGMDAGKAPTYLTLWAGVFDSKARKLTYVDAGHGHWLARLPGQGAQRVECDGGFPMGIDPDFAYKNEHVEFVPGMRVILYTDGVVEQRSPHGGIFGLERTIATLHAANGIDEDVSLLLAALAEYASFGTQVNLPFTDDVTVASIAHAP